MQNLTSQGFRVSPQQRQIWMAQQASPDQPFRAAGAFIVAGNLDSDRLRQALNRTVARHEILRTTFHRPPGIKIPFQIVSEKIDVFWQRSDLKNLPDEQQQEKVAALFAAECNQPLALDDGPVLRCHLAELSGSRAVLILSLPAICADSRTLMNLIAEIVRACESDDELPPEEVVQYADFAEWQNQLLESDDESALEGRAYWKKKQAIASQVPVLPLETRFVEKRAPEHESVTFETGEALLEELKIVASENKARLEDLLFLCWQALISRLSELRDFMIYKRCDGRKLEDLQAALGPFDRYLPVRCDVGSDLFVRQLSLVANEIQRAEEIQEYADAEDPGLLRRDVIAFEFEERASLDTQTFSVSPADLFVFSHPFKLKLSCIVYGKQLSLRLQYDRTTFHKETFERFSGYLRQMIQALAMTAPAARASLTLESIDLLSDDERRWLLFDLNDTTSEYAHDKCVHELFEAQVIKTPAAVAVVCAGHELTYEELNIRANQIAHLLHQHGVGSNECVAMCVTRSLDSIVALLGILKAGAAYVPLDPEHPLERLSTQLQKAQTGICLTNSAHLAELLEPYVRIIEFARDTELLRNQPQTNLPVAVSSDALAYVIYTSGSTGTPKGVAVRHRNLVNYAQSILKRLEVEELLHFATVSTISADLGNTCIFPSLLSGGTLHILGQELSLEPRLFSDYLSRHPIDVLKIAPSHLHALLSDNEMLPSRYLILGGEAFSRQLRDSILAIPHSCKVFNHYGPTETTVGALTFDASEQELSELVRTVPIGRPLSNTRVYVLDQQMRVVPTGVAGELYIGGAGVAAGYLNDPDLTAARFVPDLFSSEPDSRLYRTGDLARVLPDGNIEFLGRTDLQVKVRGYRVEPGEIEAMLSQHPLVSQAVVVLRGDEGRERFVAYVMSLKLRPANSDEVRQYLKQRLPDYMLPSAIIVLRSFPTTVNGKVDRGALPHPDEAQKDRVMVAPRTGVEKELAGIWSELLKVAEISVHDNFFELGGHSLLATQVVSRIRKNFNKKLQLRTIFDSPTIAKLAPVIEAAAYADPAAMQTVLDSLESLSDEEAKRLLEEHEGS
jgi:amino acid adenylation domain-containing protein